MAEALRVLIVGAGGRMGRQAMGALNCPPDFSVVAGIARSHAGQNARDLIGPAAPDLVLEFSLGEAIAREKPDVVVDLSHSSGAVEVAKRAADVGAGLVIGCTGLSAEDLAEIDRLAIAGGIGAIYAPNFAIGAVLMMRFAEMASKWMPDAEVIEMHHERKEDAPSGTALLTADLIAEARTAAVTPKPPPLLKLEGARGGEREGVHIHSVRLPGLLAHQQVLFGAPGEVLTIRHDAMDRSVYMGGLKLCARKVVGMRGLTIGLDKLLFE